MVSVALGGGTAVAVDPATGVTIVGAFGTLTLLADGSYSYVPTIGTPGGDHIDTFTYTIKDGDGDLSTATLTIAVANSSPGNIEVPPPDMGVTAVFEAGLPARTVGGVTESGGFQSTGVDQHGSGHHHVYLAQRRVDGGAGRSRAHRQRYAADLYRCHRETDGLVQL